MTEFKSGINSTTLSQPNAYTCQSTCIAMALDLTEADIMGIRKQLETLGSDPGDPHIMASFLKPKLGDRYELHLDASLADCREWVKSGSFLITHGWFTTSGHVICLDAVDIQADTTTMSYKFSVKDPWSEFSFSDWAYTNPSVSFFDGYYSAYGLYAACVAGQSAADAAQIYKRGELDSKRSGMWIHRIKP
jgi:hypothetical protein